MGTCYRTVWKLTSAYDECSPSLMQISAFDEYFHPNGEICSVTLNMLEFSGPRFAHQTFLSVVQGFCALNGYLFSMSPWPIWLHQTIRMVLDYTYIPWRVWCTCSPVCAIWTMYATCSLVFPSWWRMTNAGHWSDLDHSHFWCVYIRFVT